MGRVILHVDMDAFYASVEQLDDPALRGKPVLVGYDGSRGVVMAASYEARVFGCHSAQPMAMAKRACPQAIIVPTRFGRYHELSERVFAILGDVTPVVEPLSIDEAFLDVTGSLRLLGPPRAIARGIKDRVRDELGLTASVGVGPNKFIAKLASDLEKPDGLTVFEPDEMRARLDPLPVSRMWGVGPVTETRLRRHGIQTFADLQALTLEQARQALGSSGEHFWRLARGEDHRRVLPDERGRSISCERTFGADLQSPEHVRQLLLSLTENVAGRVRKHALAGRTVTVKIRFGDFETITRSRTLDAPTDRTDLFWQSVSELFDRWARGSFRPVRLIGVGITQLGGREEMQMPLFADPEDQRSRQLDRTTDTIRARFGHGAIGRGVPRNRDSPP